MALPNAVAAAARSLRSEDQTALTPSRAVRRGDLRLIEPPYDARGDARLGLVLNVDSTLQFIEVALVHTYPELATSMDGVVPGALARTPYDVVVQTDLRGVVWTPVQVSRLIGELSSDTVEAISDLVETGRPESTDGVRIGIPLAGPHDRRWSFKAAEGTALDVLTSDCTGEVMDGRSPWRVDRELFIPELLAASPDLNSILIELVHWLDTRTLRLTAEDALELEERGALEFDAWLSANLSADLYEALIDIVEHALTQSPAHAGGDPSKTVVAPYSRPEASEGAEVVHVIGTLVRSST
jgi:hypothetical protein